ncbi:MAG: hypothetical protein M3Q44_04930 [bacterium]|nr:hypothetical protein [bacterium]
MSSQEQGYSPRSEIELSPHVLNDGFRTVFEERDVHVRGIAPDERVVGNYVRALRLRTGRGTLVVPAVREVVVPTTTLDMAGTMSTGEVVLVLKFPNRLPLVTLALLRGAEQEGLLHVREIAEVVEFEAVSGSLGVDRSSFLNTMTQTTQLMFVSEWVGANVPDFLGEHEDIDVQRGVGASLGENLRALHDGGLIAGDTHLRQFVVRGKGENVERIDLNNIYAVGQVGSQNMEIEALGLFHELRQYWHEAATAFKEGYLNSDDHKDK